MATTFEVVSVSDVGDDVLEVRALVGEPPKDDEDDAREEIVAYGHVSATTNHYDADDYGEDGHRRDEAKPPRTMTPAEVGEYARSLVHDALPAQERVAPTPITFE